MARYRLACTSLFALVTATPVHAQTAGPPDPHPDSPARLPNLNSTPPNAIPVSNNGGKGPNGPLAKAGRGIAADGITFPGLLTHEPAT